MSEVPALKVPKRLGQKAITLAKNLELFDRHLKVDQVGDDLYIPLTAEPQTSDFAELERNLPRFEVTVHRFSQRIKRPLKLVDILGEKLPPHLLASLPHSMDFVGDIAMVEIPPELEDYKEVVGDAILKTHRQVETVLGKAGAVEGVYRLREYEVLAGVDKTETVHREYDCVYHVDLAKAYFSPRLSHEHNRVASQVMEGETVIDMFAGVGPFSILTGKMLENVHVFAIDTNPDAVQLLKENISANNVAGKVTPILGDVRNVVGRDFVGVADRVVMNLPEKAIRYIDVACEAIKPDGGIMHYYEFTSAREPLEEARIRLTEAVRKTGRDVKRILSARIVRATAPYTWQVVVDGRIQ